MYYNTLYSSFCNAFQTNYILTCDYGTVLYTCLHVIHNVVETNEAVILCVDASETIRKLLSFIIWAINPT